MRPAARRAAVTAAALTVVATGGCGQSGSQRPTAHPPQTTTAPAPSPSARVAGKAPATIVRSWAIGGFLDGIAYSRGVLWASDMNGNRIVRVDASNGRRLPDIAVADGPLTVTANDLSVWVASYNGSSVSRFDARTAAKTGTIQTPSPQPCAIALSADRVWIFDQSDGAGGYSSLQTTLRPVKQPEHAGFASAGFGAVWIPDFTGGSNTIARIDLQTHATRTAAVGSQPIQALAAGDSVWVSNTTDSTVTRLAPATVTTQATIAVPGGQTGGLAYADGLIWVTSYRGDLLAAIDPTSNTVVGTVSLPGAAENIAVDSRGDLWVTQSSGTLTELRPSAPRGT